MVLLINRDQRNKLMNDPTHYGCNIRYLEKENMFEVDCETGQIQAIKKIIEEPKK